MFERESVPYAPALVESMRSLGYSFESAIADLIDNSVSAKASRIDIIMLPDEKPTLMILDNGMGMTSMELEEAMRYGSRNPLEVRTENDLGRFGLGLKSASLSQCRELIVVSKKENNVSCYSWNLDHVIKSGQWSLLGYDEDEIMKLPMINKILAQNTGTLIYLRNFDKVAASTYNISETLTKFLDITIDHLALVFHRFISEGLKIYINNQNIEGRDPFLLHNKATQYKREQSFVIEDSIITMKAFILPHISKLSIEDVKTVGGKESLRNDQGFYIYRNKRLIIWGTWFRLERKDELSKLARVMVDIPNSLDYMWSIDIKKSSANLPDIIKKNLYNCVYESVLNSERVHNYRGRKIKENQDFDSVWEKISIRDSYQYQINRNIPVMKILKESLSENHLKLVDEMLQMLERTFPSESLYLNVAKGELSEYISEDTKTLYDQVQEQLYVAKEAGMNLVELINTFICCEPYCLDKDLVNLLEKERNEYE